MFRLIATALILFVIPSFTLAADAPSKSQANKSPESSSDNPPAATPARTKPARVQLDSRSVVRLTYGYPKWNKDPAKIDSASMLMREGSTGRVVQIFVEETAPDSSIFSGLYQLAWQNIDKLALEFYVPPQDSLATVADMKKVTTLIAERKIRRNPFILRRQPNGHQSIEIFDTPEQAKSAMRAYQAEQQVQSLQGMKTQKYPPDQADQAAQIAKEQKEKEEQARAAADRVRLEQVEEMRVQQMKEQSAKLAKEQIAKNKMQAVALAKEGLALYKNEKYEEALERFNKAVELDPENQSYYFQYGVAQYRTENFNKALVYLNLAKDESVSPVERDYFIALSHYRLNDPDEALVAFERVVSSGNEVMSPSALFYVGVIRVEKKMWDPAQEAFQKVLDTSSDPKLDDRAETYLEHVLKMKRAESERSRKWQFGVTVGEMYDSNVLTISDSTLEQGTPTETAGLRSLLLGSAKYRAYYEEQTEVSLNLDAMTMFTLTKSLAIDQDLRNADPTILTFTVPWTYKGVLLGRGYKLDIAPGYESIYMSVENNENKEIIGSILLNVSNLLVMNETVFSNFNAEIRKDQSNLASSTGDNDSSAIKVKLINTNTIFVNSEKTQIVQTETALTMNQAQGLNTSYNRVDLGLTYVRPVMWDTVANAKLGFFYLNYPQNPNERTDTSWTLSAGASKKLSELYTVGGITSYNINSSSVDANQYKKWSAMVTLSAFWGL